MVWMGLLDDSDQLLAMKHFRKTVNESLARVGYTLQDQAYDHVFTKHERVEAAFRDVCNYVARNPERAGLVATDEFASYKYSGCVVPGYPQLRPFESAYWDEFDRVIRGKAFSVAFEPAITFLGFIGSRSLPLLVPRLSLERS